MLAFVLQWQPETLDLKWLCFVRHAVQIVTISTTLPSVAVLADFWIFPISLFPEYHLWLISFFRRKYLLCRYMSFCVNFILLEQGEGGRCCFWLLYLELWEECWGESEISRVAAVPSFLWIPTALQWKGVRILFFIALGRRAVQEL